MTGQKNPIQAVQHIKWRLFKMTVAKKNEPNSVKYKMAPFKNDCGPKNPNQTVEDIQCALTQKSNICCGTS